MVAKKALRGTEDEAFGSLLVTFGGHLGSILGAFGGPFGHILGVRSALGRKCLRKEGVDHLVASIFANSWLIKLLFSLPLETHIYTSTTSADWNTPT